MFLTFPSFNVHRILSHASYPAHPAQKYSKICCKLEMLKERKQIEDSQPPVPASENAIHIAPPPNSNSENNLAASIDIVLHRTT
jgi:hypothetical protein